MSPIQALSLHMGIVLGLMRDGETRAALAQSLVNDDLNPDYVRLLRDELTDALQRAGIEKEQHGTPSAGP